MQTRFQRACQDTEGFRAWKRELLVAIIAGTLCWWWFPEQEAVSEITAISIAVVAAILIAPLLEFVWNFYHAPIRILKEENKALREENENYKSSAAREIITIEGEEHGGTWYSNKFVLDDPHTLVTERYDDQNTSIHFDLPEPCPINSLVELTYNIEHVIGTDPAYSIGSEAKIAIGRPGNSQQPLLTGSGRETVTIGNSRGLVVTLENETGVDIILTIDLINWEQHGNR